MMSKITPLIAAHRGVSGGNIPCNTYAAFEGALAQNADIIELDVSVTKDRKLYVFHPKMEPAHLKCPKLIRDMISSEVEDLRYVNQDDVPTQFKVNTLDEVLEQLKGRCVINIDKFWTAPAEIACAVRKHNMQEQVIIKTFFNRSGDLEYVSRYAPDIPYMTILNNTEDGSYKLIKGMNIRYIGAEVCFEKDTSELCSEEYIKYMHKNGLMLWANAIVYDKDRIITGGHSDDIALCGDMDNSWGWFIDKGYDIIQTDWPLMLKNYIDKRQKENE